MALGPILYHFSFSPLMYFGEKLPGLASSRGASSVKKNSSNSSNSEVFLKTINQRSFVANKK